MHYYAASALVPLQRHGPTHLRGLDPEARRIANTTWAANPGNRAGAPSGLPAWLDARSARVFARQVSANARWSVRARARTGATRAPSAPHRAMPTIPDWSNGVWSNRLRIREVAGPRRRPGARRPGISCCRAALKHCRKAATCSTQSNHACGRATRAVRGRGRRDLQSEPCTGSDFSSAQVVTATLDQKRTSRVAKVVSYRRTARTDRKFRALRPLPLPRVGRGESQAPKLAARRARGAARLRPPPELSARIRAHAAQRPRLAAPRGLNDGIQQHRSHSWESQNLSHW